MVCVMVSKPWPYLPSDRFGHWPRSSRPRANRVGVAVLNPTALASSVSRPGPWQLRLPIVGLTCAPRADQVKKALQHVAGEGSAAANLATEATTLTFVPGAAAVRVAALTTAVEQSGLLAFGATVQPGASQAIAALTRLGVRTLMISGDNRCSATAVARRIGIDDASAEVLPADKAAIVDALTAEGHVAMVDDGVNEAPALAAVDAGIAVIGFDAGAGAGQGGAPGSSNGLPTDLSHGSDVAMRAAIDTPGAAFGALNPVAAGAAMAFQS